jgi:hypothetical protein
MAVLEPKAKERPMGSSRNWSVDLAKEQISPEICGLLVEFLLRIKPQSTKSKVIWFFIVDFYFFYLQSALEEMVWLERDSVVPCRQLHGSRSDWNSKNVDISRNFNIPLNRSGCSMVTSSARSLPGTSSACHPRSRVCKLWIKPQSTLLKTKLFIANLIFLLFPM